MIEFKNVEIKYDDFIAMKNVNIKIEDGEFFTLLGPSGCGKTTTLRSLVGFISPSQGDIIIDDVKVNDIAVEKRGISMVFQSYALFPTMNVYDNIAFGLKLKRMDKIDIDVEVREVARKVDLSNEQLQKKISELSGGQQQRVAIARALVLKPKILVLDEPLSNLDANLRQQLRDELKKIQKDFGITTVYVTHDQEEALTLSNRIAVFNNGIVEQIGTPEEIYNHSETEFVCNFIGNNNKLSRDLIQTLQTENGCSLDTSKSGYIRLEKVYTRISQKSENIAKIKAVVKDKEFFGTFIKYEYQIGNDIIKNIEIATQWDTKNILDTVDIYFDTDYIMQY